MKINWKRSMFAALFTSAIVSMAGCEVDVDEGPMEEVGEEIDDVGDDG